MSDQNQGLLERHDAADRFPRGRLGILDSRIADWRERMAVVVATMREVSAQTDPMEMSRVYGQGVRRLLPTDASVSLSRRDLQAPEFRVTRSSRWKSPINPWKEKDRLPLLQGGLFAELVYGDEPRLIDDIQLAPGDPAAEYLEGFRSLAAVPMFDRGEGLNMVVLLRQEPAGFDPEQFPEVVWMSNLFGRATHTLVLAEEVKSAYQVVDYQMKQVADIQRSLLPARLPAIPTMGLAAHYQTSQRAGGDYYDIFQLPGGLWGLLIADVSGHGTPAAVLMAITHSLVHSYCGPPLTPGQLLGYVNRHLCARYTALSDTFVTAFYAVYDPADRTFVYASAGHNPPRLKRCQDGTLALLDAVRNVPLGVFPTETYQEATHRFVPGDQVVFYTDGIIEAQGPTGEQFGMGRLDKVLEDCSVGASDLLKSVLSAVEEFTAGRPAHDDRTLLVAKIH
jgi:sigma-B regulation protein RsbU (phosphoserine phosphatase)